MPETIEWSRVPSFIGAALAALKAKEDEINRMNVFPVPDGDTGTNMVLTLESVLAEVVKADPTPASISKAAVMGSLMGARGNSGVILSQIIRGFFEYLSDVEEVASANLVEAMRAAVKVAYQAVKKPVEGTMLTVIKDMADALDGLSGSAVAIEDVLEVAVHAGEESVKRTPELLPALRDAGVVDAGGYGLVAIASGALSAIKGKAVDFGKGPLTQPATSLEAHLDFAYCTEMIIKDSSLDKREIERRIERLGDSMLVVGTKDMMRLHIHTNNPGLVLEVATSAGSVSSVQINNMVEQAAERARKISAEPSGEVEVVVVASGDGVKRLFESLGARSFVNGGQSMNPSTSEILDGINRLNSTRAIILPNNKNVLLAAEQAAGLTDKTVAVVPTTSVVQGLSAMLAFRPDDGIEANVKRMSELAASVKTGEVTTAVRDSNGIKAGDFIGMFEGSISASGESMVNTALSLIDGMAFDGAESATILKGEAVTAEEVAELVSRLEREHPELEVDVHDGGQPVYHLIIGIE